METSTKLNKPINFTPRKLLFVAAGLFVSSGITGFIPVIDGLINFDEKPSVNIFIQILTDFSYLFLGLCILFSIIAIFWLLYRLVRFDEEINLL